MVSASELIGHDQSLQDHWIKRFVAFIIDALILSIVATLIFWILPFTLYWYYWTLGWPFLFGTMFFLYSSVMEMSYGATLGKQVMNMRVISLHGHADTGNIFVRNVSKVYWLILLVDWFVGFFTDGDPKQRFLDRYAGTTVILTDRLTEQQQHTYQSQQADYAPPPPEQYHAHEAPAYQYQEQDAASQPTQQSEERKPDGQTCRECGGRLILMGNGRLQCIRCGKIV